MSTCNRLDLQTLGSQLIMHKIPPITGTHLYALENFKFLKPIGPNIHVFFQSRFVCGKNGKIIVVHNVSHDVLYVHLQGPPLKLIVVLCL